MEHSSKRDIDYFTKEKLSSIKFSYSRLQAPPEAKALFLSLFPYKLCCELLQDYKISPSNGLTEIRFWYGTSKLIAVASPVIFGISRGVNRATGMSKWKKLYFDSLTGKCLATKRQDAATKLNQIGLDYLKENELAKAIYYIDMATKNSKEEGAAHFIVSHASAYLQAGCFRKAIERANLAKKMSDDHEINHNADGVVKDAEKQLEAHKHYVSGREIWISAWEERDEYKRPNKILAEAKAEFEEARSINSSNEEYRKAIHVTEKAARGGFKYEDGDISCAEAAEQFALAVGYERVGNVKLAKENFIKAKKMFQDLAKSSSKKSRYLRLVNRYLKDVDKYMFLLDKMSSKGEESEAAKELNLPILQLIESLDYERTFFSTLAAIDSDGEDADSVSSLKLS